MVNIGPHSRSQFTSIDTHNYSPSKQDQRPIIINDVNYLHLQHLRPDFIVESSYEANDRERLS